MTNSYDSTDDDYCRSNNDYRYSYLRNNYYGEPDTSSVASNNHHYARVDDLNELDDQVEDRELVFVDHLQESTPRSFAARQRSMTNITTTPSRMPASFSHTSLSSLSRQQHDPRREIIELKAENRKLKDLYHKSKLDEQEARRKLKLRDERVTELQSFLVELREQLLKITRQYAELEKKLTNSQDG